MLTAHYIGSHAKDTLIVRLGWAFTRLVQRGEFRRCTHSEAIHELHSDGTVTLASSSLREGGVRSKRVTLAPGSWLILDVPAWDVERSRELLEATRGAPYDSLGAISTALLLGQSRRRWFCNEWVAHPFLRSSFIFSPSAFAAVCASQGRDVTAEFFAGALHPSPAEVAS